MVVGVMNYYGVAGGKFFWQDLAVAAGPEWFAGCQVRAAASLCVGDKQCDSLYEFVAHQHTLSHLLHPLSLLRGSIAKPFGATDISRSG
jgi:hypothetical protein